MTEVRQSPIEVVEPTPELFAALSAAQDQAKRVPKSGYNIHAKYNYSTAEDMIAAGRAARRGTGLALLTSWVASVDEDARPWLVLSWLLTHSSGGMLRGSLNAPIQSSKRNGSDKQTAALATYLEGFVERGLMRLDREGTPPEEDRDSQVDEVNPPSQNQSKGAIARIKKYVLRTHAVNEADEAFMSRAFEAAAEHGVDEATVRSWLPRASDDIDDGGPGVFPSADAGRQARETAAMAHAVDLSSIAALEATTTPEELLSIAAIYSEELRLLDPKIVGAALAKHGERLGVDVSKLDSAMAEGAT